MEHKSSIILDITLPIFIRKCRHCVSFRIITLWILFPAWTYIFFWCDLLCFLCTKSILNFKKHKKKIKYVVSNSKLKWNFLRTFSKFQIPNRKMYCETFGCRFLVQIFSVCNNIVCQTLHSLFYTQCITCYSL